ncbi:Photosystem I PsaA/PsaB [Cynara cardunculus var. scolymus]|uniref:Photosystem I PsaA/PsaB n=1 Tax=Cynara cardunculus var. scolymus TaxID=59895 RepID=A0A118K1H1_CYNCS|nr:Photosystem I PsaA/PsaB [Cynara cardunculus var. scolymus]
MKYDDIHLNQINKSRLAYLLRHVPFHGQSHPSAGGNDESSYATHNPSKSRILRMDLHMIDWTEIVQHGTMPAKELTTASLKRTSPDNHLTPTIASEFVCLASARKRRQGHKIDHLFQNPINQGSYAVLLNHIKTTVMDAISQVLNKVFAGIFLDERGYWQGLIESIVWAHNKLKVAPATQPRGRLALTKTPLFAPSVEHKAAIYRAY